MDHIEPIAGLIAGLILWAIYGVMRYREARGR